MMSPIRYGMDKNGDQVTTIFGLPIMSIASVSIVLVAFATYATPIYVGTTYLNNLWAEIKNMREHIQALEANHNPTSSATMRAEVERLRSNQDKVLVGDTVPQQLMRSAIERLRVDMVEINRKHQEITRELYELRRDVDRNSQLKKGSDK